MPGRKSTRTISYKEVDSVSESSESSSEDEEDQDLMARIEASGAPLLKRKRTKKNEKLRQESQAPWVLVRLLSGEFGLTSSCSNTGRQKGSRSRASKSTDPDDADEADTPSSGDEGPREGVGKDGGDGEALQAANLFGKLPFELICEVSHACRDEHHVGYS